jgi:hypothetical protein
MHSRGADKHSRAQSPFMRQHASKSNFTRKPQSLGAVENFMTLKQACSSEYQGAQGAFKDSMIH